MNKRILKKKSRVKRVSLEKLLKMSFSERVDYFYSRNIKHAPLGFHEEWQAADYKRISPAYEPNDSDWEALKAILSEDSDIYK